MKSRKERGIEILSGKQKCCKSKEKVSIATIEDDEECCGAAVYNTKEHYCSKWVLLIKEVLVEVKWLTMWCCSMDFIHLMIIILNQTSHTSTLDHVKHFENKFFWKKNFESSKLNFEKGDNFFNNFSQRPVKKFRNTAL